MRIGIVGMGWVGSSVAISTLNAGVASELLLSDVRTEIAEGEAMDLAHGASFYPSCRIRAVAVQEMASCDAVVIAAGRGGKPGESRLDLLAETGAIAREIGEGLSACRGIVVVVSNPVDVLTHIVQEASGLPPARVVGTGTALDTARLRSLVGEALAIDPRSIHAHVLGEHGDSQVAAWSEARIGGKPIRRWVGWTEAREQEIAERVRRAAGEIIRRKGATNHAIGLVTAAVLRWMLRGERRVITVSRVQEGALGLEDVALSLPTVLGREGATEVLEPSLDEAEREALARSAEILREAAAPLRG